MSEDQVEALEAAARKNALMPSQAVLDLAVALRGALWQAENYRRLAEYYREGGTDAAQPGTAEPVRPGAA